MSMMTYLLNLSLNKNRVRNHHLESLAEKPPWFLFQNAHDLIYRSQLKWHVANAAIAGQILKD